MRGQSPRARAGPFPLFPLKAQPSHATTARQCGRSQAVKPALHYGSGCTIIEASPQTAPQRERAAPSPTRKRREGMRPGRTPAAGEAAITMAWA